MKNHISRYLFEMMPQVNGLYARLGSHQTMLSDFTRLQAYQKAINRFVRPDDIVVDVGTGTGILAFFAAKAGAKRVYAIESSPIASITERLIVQNNLQDKVFLIRGHAPEIKLGDQIDVIVTETIGGWGIDENVLATIGEVFRRFGTQSTRVIPEGLELYLVPVDNPSFYNMVTFWNTKIYGFDYSPVSEFAYNNIYVRILVDPHQFLAKPSLMAKLVVGKHYGDTMQFETSFRVTKPGVMHGLAGWFRMKLGHQLWLSTDPRSKTLHWKQCIFPSLTPVTLTTGDRIFVKVVVHVIHNQVQFDWHISLTKKGQRYVTFSQSTRKFTEMM